MNLSEHLSNHPIVNFLQNDFDLIAIWYDSIPSKKLVDLVKLLSPLDRANYFKFTDVPLWFSEVNSKIHNNTFVPIFGLTKNDIDIIALQFLADLVEFKLTNHSIQQLVQYLIKQNLQETLSKFLILLGANGDFSEYTLSILKIELQSDKEFPVKRWEALGLSNAPTAQEIETILTS